ncbi:DNA repair protein RadC [Thermoanaerobacter mathranii subsp. mathranii str. A3]|uniref:DNA repair protein RadC n=3 Tax=Thermoanaerobacter TaxID=1754 RepID=D3T829_THEIA|nr:MULTISPECIES: DNA repair protein RadC [Thermoanaerobacter]MDK2814600.1 repair protein RadC [Thermoanaerobacter sp.]ADD02111.1 DNA repair protein RadC [Thermoanaerobacter italicus Ab9]ADH60608.1 DNA repair protein RadC [Thermoanaerobacter mathranii subsp. mathranii str. A3]MBT1280388.1 DNA repair protein RadC [Thermoanaerobacter sp. CM-CNRG TB177]MDP9751349.1 DNA repair protein RadC [Thermoanaerobacter pentosaceus]
MIKDLPYEERPRERLIKHGAQVLSNAELIAIIIGTGSKRESAITLAQRLIMEDKGLKFIVDSSVEKLASIKGIGIAKAVKLKAAVELGRRMMLSTGSDSFTITSPEDVISLMMDEMRYLTKEYFKVIMLNVKNKVIAIETISIGSLNTSIVHPREVFKAAIERSCSSIILVHNHPSGDPTPSREDIEVTKRLVEGGNILGIKVLDHVIIGDGRGISLKEKGYYEFE